MPGDKSISHRAIMLGAIADGTTEISGFLEGADSLATLAAFRAMGVSIDGPEQCRVRVSGVGLHGLRAPLGALAMGASPVQVVFQQVLPAAMPGTLTGTIIGLAQVKDVFKSPKFGAVAGSIVIAGVV